MVSTPTTSPASGLPVAAADVREAAERLRDSVLSTPLQLSERLSMRTNAHVHLKREDLQPVRSYKIRGAFNVMLQMSEAERHQGVVCASAGNHAQGIARACNELSIRGRIFVPRTTPAQKQQRIRHFGGAWIDLEVGGSTYDDASKLAREYAQESGAHVISAFDDPRTIAGQGTTAVEILDQLGYAPDIVVVPVGGGGLLAGVSAYLSEAAPSCRVIGVEASGAASLMAALEAGGPVTLETVDPFADGTAVRRVGDVTYAMAAGLGLEVRSVPEGAAATEMLDLYQVEGIIAEPSGALSSAAVGTVGSGRTIEIEAGDTVVCLVSGGNNDISRYNEVLERSLIHEGLKHYFIVKFPQAPGALRRFLNEVLGPDDDIALFDYVKRNGVETGPAFVGITIGHAEDLPALLRRMEASPLEIEQVLPDSPLFRMFS